jgi:CRP/FNR family transcriptional regulator, anaerobic regulatory protein
LRNDLNKPKCTDKTWEGQSDCVHCAIRGRVLFADIPESDLDHLVRPIENFTYAANSVLYRSGEKNDAVYTIRQGLIKLVQYLPNGTARTIRLLRQNDIIGLEALLEEPYRHTAVTMQETKLCRIPLDVINALEKNHPELAHQLQVRWQKNLDEADRFITEFSTGSAESRTARLLLFLGGSSEGNCFNHITREDIASILSITTETASRIMADFKRRGLVTCTAGSDCSCNPEKLILIAEGF